MFYPSFKILNFEKIFIFFLLYTNKLIMTNISLEASLRTCKVDTGRANKAESNRFLNPNQMVCPLWNGRDSTGRQVSPDSFNTKTAGCHSAQDRVVVENSVSRPQYMEYITLNALGLHGDIYDNSMGHQETAVRNQVLHNTSNITGQFGYQTGYGQNILQNCGKNCGPNSSCSYESLRNDDVRLNSGYQFLNQNMKVNRMRNVSGML